METKDYVNKGDSVCKNPVRRDQNPFKNKQKTRELKK
jgi:hypothetical protein